MDKIRVLVIH